MTDRPSGGTRQVSRLFCIRVDTRAATGLREGGLPKPVLPPVLPSNFIGGVGLLARVVEQNRAEILSST